MNTDFRRAARRTLMLGTGAIALTLGSTAAFAQDAPAADLEAPADEKAEDDQQIIIVTGQKIARSLQDTQASVAVVDSEAIKNANFRDVDDILNQTANVASLFDGSGFAIRGLRNTGAGAGSSSDVAAIFIDGVFIPSNLLTNGAFSLWDVGSVEVFRGPQSTIQGRNALAGAVVVNTVEPGDFFEGDFQLEAAEFNSYRASGAVTVPIAPGQISVRLAADYLSSDGFVTNTFLNEDDIDRSEGITARATLKITPEFAPDFTARFGYTYSDNEEGENRVIESIFRATGDRISNQNNTDRQGAESHIAYANLSYDFSPEFSVTAITGYIDTNSFFLFDPDSSNPIDTPLPLPGGFEDELIFQDNSDQVFTQELRLTYESDDLSVLLGGYYFDSNGNLNSDTTTVVGTDFAFPDPQTLAFVLGLDVPTATFIRQQVVTAVPAFPVNLINISETDQRNYAIFGEATWDISDQFSITLGARYDNERVVQDIVNGVQAEVQATGDPTIDALLAQVVDQFSNIFNFAADNTFDAFLPKAAVVYNFTDDVSLGFTYQRAYRAGGLAFNTFRASLAPDGSDQNALEDAGIVNSFNPEFSNNYELSFRSVWGDGDFILNANAYLIDYTDQLIVVQLSGNPLDTITDNAGTSRLQGFEIESTFYPTDGLSIFANIGVADTEFTDGAGTLGNDITGFQFINAPTMTVGFGGRYEHDSGFYVNMQNRLTGGTFTSFIDVNEDDPTQTERRQNPSGRNDAGFTIDLNVGYEFDDFTIEVFARNLLDERFFTFDTVNDLNDPTNANSGFAPNNQTFAIVGTPQQFGVRLTGSF